MRVLIVEDEPRMLELLRVGLYENGFTVMTAADGETGLQIAMTHELDLIVLDIGLPKLDGCQLMQALREHARWTPVLMLTARDREDDIIRGFDLGADDYLTKPFSFAELLARMQSITRARREVEHGTIEAGGVEIDLIRHKVTRERDNIDLTRLEFLFLVCLVRGAGLCVSRKILLESVWGQDRTVGPSALDVLVNSLRAKIDAPYTRKLIGTVRGSGYVFKGDFTAAHGPIQ
jgi:DNA-binding response OmpR family regulator